MVTANFSAQVLNIDCEKESAHICDSMRRATRNLKKRGVVLGVSGGIDSSVCAALAVKAFGAGKVIALQMPEKHSADETMEISGRLADHFGIRKFDENISKTLEAVGFYERYNKAVQSVIPEYDNTWKSKIVLPNIIESDSYSIFSVVALSPEGKTLKKRLNLTAYLEILAATNFKQRIRKMMEYYYADRFNYAVIGTPNRLEYDQGFFVKLGDGAADLKPIAHLYKTQVYQMAEYLDVPEEIRKRPPTTDTYSLPQGQDEFYFSLPHDKMDLCLYGKNQGVPAEVVAKEIGLTQQQAERVYEDIEVKRASTRYLHAAPALMGPVPEIKD